MDTETKTCTMCGEEKPITAYRSRVGVAVFVGVSVSVAVNDGVGVDV